MAEGLSVVLQQSLKHLHLGIQSIDIDNCRKLVGIGMDRASGNIAKATWIKGIMEKRYCGFTGCGT